MADIDWDDFSDEEEGVSWKADSPVDVLSSHIDSYFIDLEDDAHDDDYFHPSQLHWMCPVEEYFTRISDNVKPVGPEKNTRLLFESGNSFHEFFQDKVFGPTGLLVGQWRCTYCGETVYDSPMPKACDKCGRDEHHYIEVGFTNPTYNICGTCDGVLYMEGKEHLMEIKSKSSKSFPTVTKPNKRELMQASVYMDMLDFSECIFVFGNRDNYQYKFVMVDKDESLVNEAYEKINYVRSSITKEQSPIKIFGSKVRKCSKPDCYRAKNCSFKDLCWDKK